MTDADHTSAVRPLVLLSTLVFLAQLLIAACSDDDCQTGTDVHSVQYSVKS